jgi:small-conductance mechanosensitive channel
MSEGLRLFNVTFVGVNAENGKKLLFTVIFLFLVWAVRRLLLRLFRLVFSWKRNERIEFWADQGVRLGMAAVTILGLASIWFNNPSQLVTVSGLVGAGVAFALQKVITAIAGYFVLLRGKTFNLGDRITMGGVRGDVIGLGFIQTTIMEMGEPPPEQPDAPAMWVRARQYTGRIVTVTNDKIFDQPVYNYTRDFPYIWEEMQIPVSYKDNRDAAEQILLDVATRHTVKIEEISEHSLRELERRFLMKRSELKPRVFMRLTDNWVELSVRFIAHESGIRELKDKMSREIIAAFEKRGVGIASGTYEIVGFPPVEIKNLPNPQNGA